MPNVYRLGPTTRTPDDQFLRVLNIPGSGMRNTPGIRPFKFINLKLPVHADIVLVTHESSSNRAANPWEDSIDLHAGRIIYWGDARRDPTRTIDDFLGNRALRAAFDLALADERVVIPPILHFSKPRPGLVRFNGLCVFDRLELTWFEDHGFPVQNCRAQLTVLDTNEVDVDWLHRRARHFEG